MTKLTQNLKYPGSCTLKVYFLDLYGSYNPQMAKPYFVAVVIIDIIIIEHTFSNYVRIRDVVQKTCQRRWTIGKSG